MLEENTIKILKNKIKIKILEEIIFFVSLEYDKYTWRDNILCIFRIR